MPSARRSRGRSRDDLDGGDLADGPDGELDADPAGSTADEALDILLPRLACRWLRLVGVNADISTLRRWILLGDGPAFARFESGGGQGGVKIRRDQLIQWAEFRLGVARR